MGKESIHQTDMHTVYDKQPFDKEGAVMRQLEAEAQTKMAVVIEGPPIYLWPPRLPSFDTLQWRSKSFRKGWSFVNEFARRIPERKSFQYVLVDDLNYLPENAENSDLRSQIELLRSSSPEMEQSALFQAPNDQIKVVLESRLAAETKSLHCSRLDAEFNARKIIDQVGPGGNPMLYAGNANRLMLPVVNPDTAEIRSEQLNMMMELYRLLRKHPEFQKYSKKWSSEAITETYRHVWLDSNGSVKGKTKPVFHGSHFSFIDF